MGSVKLETRNEGRGLREWDYVPLSEPRVVAKQITNRWKVDESQYPLTEETSNPLCSNGVFPFSEPVLCSYIDQDMLIEEARQTRSENNIVHWSMMGYAISDIAEHCGVSRQTIYVKFNSAVDKICSANNKRWQETYI